MQRITITIDDDLLDTLDQLCRRRGYTSRSEAVRDLVRLAQIEQAAQSGTRETCVAVLAYVYEHGTRNLAKRLTGDQHNHHELSVATLHVHLNHDDCLEVSILRGGVSEVQAFANSVMTQRGVRHGNLHAVPQGAARQTAHAHKTGKKF